MDRKCEILRQGQWRELPFYDLERGHVYRLFEEDGTAVDGGEVCLALSDAYQDDGVWTVRSEPMGMVPNVADKRFVKTICIDFDGVVHDYEGGWQGKDTVSGKPVPGAFVWLGRLLDDPDFEPVIYSSRSDELGGVKAMIEWFRHYGFMRVNDLRFPTQKPPAWLTIDDRAVCFTGKFPSLCDIADFEPWYRK